MSKVKCPSCGNINPTTSVRCSLCDKPIEYAENYSKQESSRANPEDEASLPGLLLITLAITALCVGLPAPILYFVIVLQLQVDLDPAIFGVGYLAFWVIASFLSHLYAPKDHYDLGYNTSVGLIDRPFTLRDDVDRAHMGLGVILFPVNIVREHWIMLLRRIKNR